MGIVGWACCGRSLWRAGKDEEDVRGKKRRLTKPRPSRTASTMPAVKDEQLKEEKSLGTDIWRSRSGSLSMIMSVHGIRGRQERCKEQDSRTFVLVLYALFDRVCGSSKDGAPNLCMDGHESGEEAYFAFWCL